MKILAAGGGSGGHVTPVVAVLREIKEIAPNAEIHFWCDKKFARQAMRIMHDFDESISISTIHSGKLRRYHTLSVWKQLSSFRMIVFPNIRDGFFVGVGMVESVVRLMLWRPDVVFTKGGFVCLPIGMAAHLLRIPLVIHDSDAHPGLTNRVLAKWATSIATGAPLKFYPYPLSRSHYVGVPVANEFAQPLNDEQRRTAKVSLGFEASRPLIVITGGGLGAKRLNDATMEILPALLEQTNVLLVSGDGQYDELASSPLVGDARFQLHAFVSQGMATMLGAADLVVARAGATTILELAGLAKPTILVPNAFLTGGHQLKNAAVYAEKGAVSVVTEEDIEKSPTILLDEIFNILSDHDRAASMGHAFRQFAKPDAAKEVAKLVINAVKRK